MKITVFTSNQPRHGALVHALSKIADEIHVIQECNTVFPGAKAGFYKKSPIMQDYFSRVIKAEETVFGGVNFLPANAQSLSLQMGDLNDVSLDHLSSALDADLFVVFGASFIKNPLINLLIEKKAINIHIGVSPFYRGAACNFWASFDGHYDLVGATIHRLSKGLDSGDMLFHALPRQQATEPFEFGMRAVKSAHLALCDAISTGEIHQLEPVTQDRTLEIRYARIDAFDDNIAQTCLNNLPTQKTLTKYFDTPSSRRLLRPRYF